MRFPPPLHRNFVHPVRWRRRAYAIALAALLGTVVPTASGAAAALPTIDDVVRAAAAAKKSRLEDLLSKGAPSSGTDKRQQTPLQTAAARNRNENVAVLLSHGAEIDEIGARGATALGWASRNGHLDTVRILLDAGAAPDAAESPSRCPIALAVAHGHADVARELLQRGSEMFQNPTLGIAVLRSLKEANDPKLGSAIGSGMSDLLVRSAGFRQVAAPIVATSSNELAETMLQLLAPASSQTEFRTELLFAAIRYKRRDIALKAIEGGADVNATHPRHGTPLALAMKDAEPSMVTMLVAADANWRLGGVDSQRVREIAGEMMWDRQAASLLERINEFAGTPMELSALGSFRDAYRAYGTPNPVDARDARGETLLFRAAERGDLRGVQKLLRLMADPAATVERWPGDGGWTPLMVAAAEGQTSVVSTLLLAGAAVDQRNHQGRTALFFATFYDREPAVRALLAAGASPGAADNRGASPLTLASHPSRALTLKYLQEPAPTAVPDANAPGSGSVAAPQPGQAAGR